MRLLLVDDHPLVFDALTLILRRLPDHISSEFLTSFGDAVNRALKPPKLDLVLLDLGLPGYQGISALQEFRQRCPELNVAVISALEDPDTITACLRAGAMGYIPKTSVAADFRGAIESMLAGERFSPLNIVYPVTTDINATVAAQFNLTGRQLEVLKVLARGKSNSDIGDELGLAVNTVKVHVGALLDKLHASNRTEAVTIARRHGLPYD